VMGSKNLKAIVARGTTGVRIADRKRFLNRVQQLFPLNSAFSGAMADLGVHVLWSGLVSVNMNPGLWSVYDWNEHYGIKKWYEVKKDVKACSACCSSCHTASCGRSRRRRACRGCVPGTGHPRVHTAYGADHRPGGRPGECHGGRLVFYLETRPPRRTDRLRPGIRHCQGDGLHPSGCTSFPMKSEPLSWTRGMQRKGSSRCDKGRILG